MEKFAITALLLMALALPVVLFWLLRSRSRLNGLQAAGIAVAAGWALNLAWAFAVQQTAANDPSHANDDTLAIAAALGWICPSVLVLLTWLVRRLVTHRAA
jgi:flagellar biogenesis protein FliO